MKTAVKAYRGFSLVEVTMAIGIVSFALLAIVGLIPVGLKSVKDSREHAAVANALDALANRIRNAGSEDERNYSTVFSGQEIAYEINGSPVQVKWNDLVLEGEENSGRSRRLVAQLSLTPPMADAQGTVTNAGCATICLAWGAQADPHWDGDSWSRVEGFISTSLRFLPAP